MSTILTRSIAAIACVTFAAAGSALAVDYTWQGGGSNSILDPANWVGGVVPPNDGTNINFTPTDRLLFTAGNKVIPNDSDRQINFPAGSQFLGNTDGDKIIDARVNVQGTGPDGSGAFFFSSGGWGKPQNVALTGPTLVTADGPRFRLDGGPNRLDLAGQTLTVQGAGETNFVNTNIYNTTGTIVANHLVALESQTRVDPNVTIDMSPGTTLSSWDGGNARREAAVVLRNTAVIETRLRDSNLTYTGPITVGAGDTGILRAIIQQNGTEAGNGVDMRLNVIGSVTGAGSVQKDGNGTVNLSGNNTHSGGTNLNGGAVLAASDTAFGTGPVNVNAASSVHISNAGGAESRDDLARDAEVAPSSVINPTLTGLQSVQAFDNTRWSYTGKINNTSGADAVYTFIESYDDDVFLQVDDQVVINDATWDVPASGQVTLTPGEHDIRISVRNGGGGAGPNNGNNNAFPGFNVADPSQDRGVAYTTSLPAGGATTNPADYQPLGRALEVYQATDRTVSNPFVLNSPLTLTTTEMNGYRATVNGAISGADALIVQGSTAHTTDQLILAGANTYAGNTDVEVGGNLRLTGSHTNAATYAVDAGAGLSVEGSLNVTDLASTSTPADLTITNNGTAAFTGTATLRLDIFSNLPGALGAAGENDELITDGPIALTLGGALAVGNPNNISNFAQGDTFDLFDWSVAPAGTFASVDLPALGSGLSWDTSDIYDGGTVAVVPEPSAIGLLAVISGAALLRRRRR